jgi:hypothetical protein
MVSEILFNFQIINLGFIYNFDFDYSNFFFKLLDSWNNHYHYLWRFYEFFCGENSIKTIFTHFFRSDN